MKPCRLGVLVAAVVAATALLVNGTNGGAILWRLQHEPVAYCTTLAIQFLLALAAAVFIAVAVSVAGEIVRRFARWAGLLRDVRTWRGLTAEGCVIGLVVVGAWLRWAPTDVYLNPDRTHQVEVRLASLIEGPLGIHPCSDAYVPVTVRYRDENGHTIVQQSCEGRYSTNVERITARDISWSKGNTPCRAVVMLPETGACLFFPDPIEEGDYCPPQSAIDAYLNGELATKVEQICREAGLQDQAQQRENVPLRDDQVRQEFNQP